MKKIYPDIYDITRVSYIEALGFCRKFARLWGTTTVNGVVYLNPRYTYYPKPGSSDPVEDARLKKNFVALQKMLGITLTGNNMKGIKNAYLYLNAGKVDSSLVADWSPVGIVDNLRSMLGSIDTVTETTEEEVIEYVTVKLQIRPKIEGRNPKHLTAISANLNPNNLLRAFKSEYKRLIDAGFVVTSSANDPYLEVLSTVLPYISPAASLYELSNGREELDTALQFTNSGFVAGTKTSSKSYSADIRINVSRLTNIELGKIAEFLINTKLPHTTALHAMLRSEYDSYIEDPEDADNYSYYYPTAKDSPLWYRGMLSTKAYSGEYMKTRDAPRYILDALDSGHKKKKQSRTKRVIGYIAVVVAVIIGIVVTIYTAGTGASVWGWVGALAAGVSATAMAGYVMMALAASLGQTTIADTMGHFLKQVQPLIIIASVIGIVNIFVEAGKQAAAQVAQQAGKSIAEVTAREVAVQMVKNLVGNFVKSYTTNISFSRAVEMVSFSFDLYQKNRLASIEADIKSYRSKLAEMEAADEQSQMKDIIKEMMRAQPQLLQQDWSGYAAIYDRPYEHWSTPFHTGCSQANTVKALWLT